MGGKITALFSNTNIIQRFAVLLLPLLFIALSPCNSHAQSHNASAYDHLVNPKIQKEHINALTAPQTMGRATGSSGSAEARQYIEKRFEEYGIEKRGLLYSQQFLSGKVKGYNIIGEIKSTNGSREYIIVGAHYDHLGEIKGKVYPGADDNASGVAALLELARIFSKMKEDGKEIGANLLFVAFDAKEQNLAGSRYFAKTMRLHNGNIKCMINMDQIGSTLAPPHNNRNYLLVLGRDSLDTWASTQLDLCNRIGGINMDVDYTFYNSKNFYDIFYRLSDHHSFVERGITALFFTSGITGNTYKETDTADTISYPVLTNRIRLIFHFIYHLISE